MKEGLRNCIAGGELESEVYLSDTRKRAAFGAKPGLERETRARDFLE